MSDVSMSRKEQVGMFAGSPITGAGEFYASEYRNGYRRGRTARETGLYKSWEQCAEERTWHGLYGFIDGFEEDTP